MNGKKLAALLSFVVALTTAVSALLGAWSSTTTIRTVKTPAATIAAAPAVVAVDNADKNAAADNPIVLTPKARDVAASLAAGAATGKNDLKSREHPGLPSLSGPITGPVAQLLPPFASDTVPGCRTRTLPTNWSQRSAGATPKAFWLHYTAGPDVPNSRSDVDGLTAFGSSPSAAVSWHLNMDKDGNCDYNVPLRYKAWTEAGGNSTGISIEVAGTGSAPYLRPGGYRELARIYLEINRRYGIPLRLGALSNCNVTRPGIVTHWMGGPCSGGHVDIKPFVITQVIATLKKYVAADQAAACSKRTACRMGRRHAAVHRELRNGCGRAKTPACQRLRARNAYMHRYAAKHHLKLVTS